MDYGDSRPIGIFDSGIGGLTVMAAIQKVLPHEATIYLGDTARVPYGTKSPEVVTRYALNNAGFLASKGIGKITQLVGKALPNLQETDHFDLQRQGQTEYDYDRCIGCGQCYIVCNDAGGQALEWDVEKRRPKLIDEKCLSCMVCSFVCPVPDLITYKEMPKDWKRKETAVMDPGLEKELNLQPFEEVDLKR